MNYFMFMTVVGGRYRVYYCAAPEWIVVDDREIEVTPGRVWLTCAGPDWGLFYTGDIDEDMYEKLRQTDPGRELIYLEAGRPPQNFDHLRR